MMHEHVEGKDIKEELTRLLREKYGEKVKYYSKNHPEGMVLPAFVVDVRLVREKDETVNVVTKEFSCRIIYLQEDSSAEDAELDQYTKAKEIRDLLKCKDKKRNPKGAMIVNICDRYINVSEFGIDYIGREGNILEASFILRFLDFKENLYNDDELIDELKINEKLED